MGRWDTPNPKSHARHTVYPGYEYVALLAFSLVSLCGFLSGLLLPETNGRELPVTIKDAEEQDNAPSIKDCLRCKIL